VWCKAERIVRRKQVMRRGAMFSNLVVIPALVLGQVAPVLAQPVLPPPAMLAPGQQGGQFDAATLDSLLAPVALYPDPLLSQLLIAATYPAEVVAAARWLDNPANRALTGDRLGAALEQQSWDPSVKSLVPFGSVVAMMADRLQWTEQLGQAVATQQGDVLDAVQRLRHQAQRAGRLQSTQQIVVQDSGPQIVIEPASPQMIYVPAYDPTVMYGAWPYPVAPVVLGPPPGWGWAPGWETGLAFGAGVVVLGSLWALSRPDWGHRNFIVDQGRWNRWAPSHPVSGPVWRPGPAPGFGHGAPPPAAFRPGPAPGGFHQGPPQGGFREGVPEGGFHAPPPQGGFHPAPQAPSQQFFKPAPGFEPRGRPEAAPQTFHAPPPQANRSFAEPPRAPAARPAAPHEERREER